ncbi:MAG: hypothetical protein DWP95_12365 [Proteobacteria bacterium]|nr:MAG: hypothetical protein DWP95_12365 [Pseudomonadota bacterium]
MFNFNEAINDMSLPNKKQFEQYSTDNFEIVFSQDHSLSCRIDEVKAGLQPHSSGQNEQFSVVFACSETQVFEQGVYHVSHPKLGGFELFLVPIFGDDKGVHYEAVFT